MNYHVLAIGTGLVLFGTYLALRLLPADLRMKRLDGRQYASFRTSSVILILIGLTIFIFGWFSGGGGG
jgi:ABC-type nickel/cobalt efflux system permease component RcnA